MPFHLSVLFVAVVATCLTASTWAATSAPAPSISTSAPEVNTTSSTETWTGTTENGTNVMGVNEIVIAQAPAGDKRVHVVKSGNVSVGINGDFASIDIDGLLSRMLPDTLNTEIQTSGVRSIKNAPYRADVFYERTQNLPDGNVIEKRTSSAVYRDSAGRTRQESRDTSGNITSISIYDAVDGARFSLNPKSKTATKFSFDRDLSKRITELRDKATSLVNERGNLEKHMAELRDRAKAISIREMGTRKREPMEEINVSVVRFNDAEGSAATDTSKTERIVLRTGDKKSMADALFSEAMTTGPIGGAWKDARYRANATTKSLGTKEMEGVRAEGTMKSYTIPAGELGNRNPITVTSESWYSPELQVTVYSKTSDPRSGDTVYRLANVSRAEQPMSLFSVPGEYTIKEPKVLNFTTPK